MTRHQLILAVPELLITVSCFRLVLDYWRHRHHDFVEAATSEIWRAVAIFACACGFINMLELGLFGNSFNWTFFLAKLLKALASVNLSLKVNRYMTTLVDLRTSETHDQIRRRRTQLGLVDGSDLEAFENMPVGVAIVSLDAKFMWVNEAVQRTLGRTFDELKSITCPSITYPPDLIVDQQYLQEVNHGRIRSYTIPKRYTKKDGALVHAILGVHGVWENDRLLYYIVTITEIGALYRMMFPVMDKNHEDALSDIQDIISELRELRGHG